MTISDLSAAAIHPDLWRDWVTAQPTDNAHRVFFDRAFLQCWSGTNPEMPQPALDHHTVVLHQGGAKRINRRGGRGSRIVDTPLHAHSTIESGSSYRWTTEGPIAFSHLYVEPGRFADIVGETFDRDARSISFAESLGRADPHVARLFELIIDSRLDPDWASIADFYLNALLIRLATTSVHGGEFRRYDRISLTARTVANVRAYIDEHIADRITLDDLAAVAGYSRYHFARAFKISTGLPPYAFLLRERVRHAKALLQSAELPICDVARMSGFATHTHFSTRFREIAGVTPVDYRRRHRGGAGGDDGPPVRTPGPAGQYTAR